jgi:hypothetical protein
MLLYQRAQRIPCACPEIPFVKPQIMKQLAHKGKYWIMAGNFYKALMKVKFRIWFRSSIPDWISFSIRRDTYRDSAVESAIKCVHLMTCD